jgi:hypothetical protein
MSVVASILLRLLVIGATVFTPPAFAQEMSPGARDSGEAKREWHDLAKGRKEFEVSDPALLPSRLIPATFHTGCRVMDPDGIKEHPVRFTEIARRRLAIVFCPSISGSHIVLDLSTLHKLRVLEFPFIEMPEGFGTTLRPGWLTWDKDSAIFQAVTGTDMKPSWDIRHTYRFDNYRGFVLLRVEIKGMPGYVEWMTLWEAPRWSLPEVKQ